MKRGLLPFALILLTALPTFAASALFRSNAFGMQLEPLASYRKDEFRWVLQVTTTPSGEIRRLFDGGKEARRWEISPVTSGGTEEREIVDGALAARRVYSTSGDLLQEDQYSKGALTQRSLSTYAASRLSRLSVLSADGKVLYTLDYFYTLRGGLREVRRSEPGGAARSSAFMTDGSGLAEERNAIGDRTFVSRYDTRGRVIEREQTGAAGIVSQEDFEYREDTDVLLASTKKKPAEGRTIDRSYDKEGRLFSEKVSTGGKVVEETAYTRDEKGRAVARERRSSAGLEQWRYTYDSAGKETREEYLQRGSLAKVTVYGEGNTRTEELYENGGLFLKVYFDGERRLKEEVYAGGKVVRQRTSE